MRRQVVFVEETLLLDLQVLAVGVAATVTVTFLPAEPPAPEQARVYVVDEVSTVVLCEPLVLLLPDQPPKAIQLVA